MVWKKDLTPLSKGGTISKHVGKGSRSMPTGRNPGNNYSKPPSKEPDADDMAFHNASNDGMPVNDHDEDDA